MTIPKIGTLVNPGDVKGEGPKILKPRNDRNTSENLPRNLGGKHVRLGNETKMR